MYNGKYVIAGLVVFVVLMLAPFLYNLVTFTSYAQPELKLPEGMENCIEDTEFMRKEHMQILDDWRDLVVRDGLRVYTASDGKQYEMSLQNTCMDCHSNKVEFCDKCHDVNSVDPYCWTCHFEPKGND